MRAVIPAEAGIQEFKAVLDSRLRGSDTGNGVSSAPPCGYLYYESQDHKAQNSRAKRQMMRAVVQRVKSAKVDVAGRTVGEIGTGLLVFLGVGHDDSEKDCEYLAGKIIHLRIFSDEQGLMNRSVLEMGGGILVVSQFTLWGDCLKGRRPSFTRAAPPEKARMLYEHFTGLIREKGLKVATGVFQEMMEVHLLNDGPVTMLLDSEKVF
jgi:D-tyrosyl-tRNA(Tyr) deacylase